MNEQDWLKMTDPDPMLDLLMSTRWGRKLRLFACSCCRRIWDLLDDHARMVVDGGESMAEGGSFPSTMSIEDAQSEAEGAALYTVQLGANRAAYGAADLSSMAVGLEAAQDGQYSEYSRCILVERHAQSQLLRCIIGPLPFRPVSLDAASLPWHNGTIPKLAHSIYQERAFDRLSILADALEEAGCDNAEILAHCRQPGVHARGCWVVDLVLGKE